MQRLRGLRSERIERLEPETIGRNRLLPAAIALEANDYEGRRSFYGCPPRLRGLLDRPINDEITCTDLLVSAARLLGSPCSFLEIGVSLGRNLWVLANTVRESTIVGLDWERINPALESRLAYVAKRDGGREYCYGGNRLVCVRGDVLDESAWRRLRASSSICFSLTRCTSRTLSRTSSACSSRSI